MTSSFCASSTFSYGLNLADQYPYRCRSRFLRSESTREWRICVQIGTLRRIVDSRVHPRPRLERVTPAIPSSFFSDPSALSAVLTKNPDQYLFCPIHNRGQMLPHEEVRCSEWYATDEVEVIRWGMDDLESSIEDRARVPAVFPDIYNSVSRQGPHRAMVKHLCMN
jgi:hypothetical protein